MLCHTALALSPTPYACPSSAFGPNRTQTCYLGAQGAPLNPACNDATCCKPLTPCPTYCAKWSDRSYLNASNAGLYCDEDYPGDCTM